MLPYTPWRSTPLTFSSGLRSFWRSWRLSNRLGLSFRLRWYWYVWRSSWRKTSPVNDPHLVEAVKEVSRTIRECTFTILHALAASKSCDQPATKADLKELETKLMAKLDELVAAATALSTASDAVSVKLDTLITDVDRVLAALQNADLPPEATAAIATLQASRDKAAAAGDKVDAEVAKVDTVLPQPAPPAPTT